MDRNRPYQFVWITGDENAQKYIIDSYSPAEIQIHADDSTKLTLIKNESSGEWKIQHFQNYPFLIFFEKKKDGQIIMATDQNLIGTIIVGEIFDGRSWYSRFWRVINQNKTGNLELRALPIREFLICKNPGQHDRLVIPQDESFSMKNEVVKTTKSRKKDSAGQLKYKDWRLYRWEPDRAYFNNWLSD